MVFTLHRYIFRELLKVFFLATVALTLMMSLGSILSPVQEYGVGPEQVIHLMVYFLPITLTFVLPIAGLFAASLVYGRFASDNELDACKASGISLLTLVYPGLALAIIVATANLILSFHVMPIFVHLAEKSIKADAQQILFRNIQRKGFYKPSDSEFLIYADQANSQNGMLSGVVVAEMKDNKIEKIISAESAKVTFDPHDRFNEVQIAAYKTYQMDSKDVWFFESLLITKPFPSLMADSVKFKKIDEMKRIQVDPIRFYPIEKLAREVSAQFTAELLAESINEKINSSNDNFYNLYSSETFIEFSAHNCSVQDNKRIGLSGEVVVLEYDATSKKLLNTLRCTEASLDIEGDELAPVLKMNLRNATLIRADGSEDLKMWHMIRGLLIPGEITRKFATGDVLQDISPESVSAGLQQGPSQNLMELQARLQQKLQKTLIQIRAEVNSRLVFGIGCVSMIMIGIGLGIILNDGHLLSAFAASAIPAMLLVVCIMMGKNLAKNPHSPTDTGIMLMWMGLVLLSLLTLIIYRRLLKN